jgi:signal transduction histidine kinase
VIQRVFAVGLNLQDATRLTTIADVVARVDRAVDDLDATITEIRTSIYELGGSVVVGGLRHSVVELAADLAPMIGVRPDVAFNGPIDNAVSQRIADNLLAVLREALTNTAKHASATRVAVTLSVSDHVTLEIVDDGVGVSLPRAANEGLGLANLRKRANRLHGIFEVSSLDSGGTRVSWSVPVSSGGAA